MEILLAGLRTMELTFTYIKLMSPYTDKPENQQAMAGF